MFKMVCLLLLAGLPLGFGAPVDAAETHPGQKAFIGDVAAHSDKSRAELTTLLDGAHKQQSILDAMNNPAEAKPWPAYRDIFIQPDRVRDGAAFYRHHRHLIEQISDQYGVPGPYLVAILGVETNYGHVTGSYRVLDALVTLAFYYPPRSDFFRGELKTLLQLPADKLAGPLDSLKGSYAGAQGWGQFMPSSIKAYAVDADDDGRTDLNGSLPDILASVANYFHAHGWQPGQPVATPAHVDDVARAVQVDGVKPRYALEQWLAWGYRPAHDADPGLQATLLTLDGKTQPKRWLTFRNFYVITRYNHSAKYAMVVQQLATAIADKSGLDMRGKDAS